MYKMLKASNLPRSLSAKFERYWIVVYLFVELRNLHVPIDHWHRLNWITILYRLTCRCRLRIKLNAAMLGIGHLPLSVLNRKSAKKRMSAVPAQCSPGLNVRSGF